MARLSNKKRNNLKEAVRTNVAKYPLNISRALRLSANETNCTFGQASYVWYGKPTKKLNSGFKQSLATYAIITKGGMVMNSKTAQAVKATKKTLLLDRSIEELGTSSTEDKVAFFDMVFK